METRHAVYLGNLCSDVHAEALQQSIIHLLHQINISVTAGDIIVHKKRHAVFAFVRLSSEQEVGLVLDLLSTQEVLTNLDLSELVKAGRELRVAPKQDRWQLVPVASDGNQQGGGGLGVQPMRHILPHKSQWADGSPSSAPQLASSPRPAVPEARKTYTVVAGQSGASESHYYVKRDQPGTPLFRALPVDRPDAGPSNTDGTPSDERGDDEWDPDEDVIMLTNVTKLRRRKNQRKKRRGAAKLCGQPSGELGSKPGSQSVSQLGSQLESQPGCQLGSHPSFQPGNQPGLSRDGGLYHRQAYVLDEVLGNESRLLEFKRGQGMYMHRQLADHVAVYTSAFLNSHGGTLLVGVTDTGGVKGVDIDRVLEDRLRLIIDQTMARISPAVLPAMYRVHFVPVTDAHDQPLGDRKVVEVSLLPGISGMLYQTPAGDVYVRRDASIQGPLRASDIQEWTRMMLYAEQLKKDNEIANLREKEKQLLAELSERRANEDKLTSLLKGEVTESVDSTILLSPRSKGSTAMSSTKSKDKSKVCVIL